MENHVNIIREALQSQKINIKKLSAFLEKAIMIAELTHPGDEAIAKALTASEWTLQGKAIVELEIERMNAELLLCILNRTTNINSADISLN